MADPNRTDNARTANRQGGISICGYNVIEGFYLRSICQSCRPVDRRLWYNARNETGKQERRNWVKAGRVTAMQTDGPSNSRVMLSYIFRRPDAPYGYRPPTAVVRRGADKFTFIPATTTQILLAGVKFLTAAFPRL